MKPAGKILVARTDRLGDVLLSLPTLNYLRQVLTQSTIHFLCAEQYSSLLEPYLSSQKMKFETFKSEASINDWKVWLAQRQFDGVLFLHSDRKLLIAAKSAKIPVRVGVYSKPWSFLSLSGGLWQRRSRAEKNESDYNLDVANRFVSLLKGKNAPADPKPILLDVLKNDLDSAWEAVAATGLEKKAAFITIHPGMGGSALNLSPRQYSSLAETLEKKTKLPVVITIGPAPADTILLEALLRQRPKLRVVKGLTLAELKAVFKISGIVIAPSTGPLHLAHLAGAKTVGLFSPVRTHRAERWAPRGGEAAVSVIYPRLPCPGKRDCVGSRCRDFFCMDQMPWNDLVFEQVRRHLES